MNLSWIIQQAVLGDKQRQAEAEAAIVSLRNQNMEQFMLECAVITNSETENEVARQTAATILGRSLFLKDPNTKVYFWDQISMASKDQIKHLMLSTLVSPCQKARRGAGSTISYIASVQVPRNQWLEVIQKMVDSTNNENEEIKKISLMTLGFICEQFKQNSIILSEGQCSSILAVFIQCSKDPSLPIRMSALTALRDSFGFIGTVMCHKTVRDHVVNLILQTIEVPETTNLALQTLIEFSKFYFEYLNEYIVLIYNATFPIITKDQELSVLALDVWDTIGYQYIERQNNVKRMKNKEVGENLLAKVQEGLAPAVLSRLILVDNNESLVRDTALKTMTTISEVCGSLVFNVVTTFVSNTIQSREQKIRQASALAFSTLCECHSEKKTVEELLSMGLDSFVKLLTDESRMVVESTVSAFVKFCEFYPGVFLRSVNYANNIEILLRCLSINQKIAQLACLAICHLTDGLMLDDNKHCALKKEPFQLLDRMTKFAFVTKVNDIILSSFMAAVGILQACTDINLASNYIDHMMDKYREYMGPGEIMASIRAGILTAMHSAILVLRGKVPDDDVMLDKVFAFVCTHFDSHNEVDSDGLYLLSAISMVYAGRFLKYLDRAWAYIFHGLSKTEDQTLFKATVNCISDIARSMGSQFGSKYFEAMDVLLQCIRSNAVSRDMKCQIFLALADCMVNAKDKAYNYITKVIEVIDLGFQGVVELQQGSPDDFEYSEHLKESVIDFYECVTAAVNDPKSICVQLRQHFSKLVSFMILTTKRDLNPTLDYLMQCMYLVLDCANCYLNDKSLPKQQITSEVNKPEVKDILEMLRLYQHLKQVKELLNYASRLIRH